MAPKLYTSGSTSLACWPSVDETAGVVAVTGFVSGSLLMRVSGIVPVGGTDTDTGADGDGDAVGPVIAPVAVNAGVGVADMGIPLGNAVSAVNAGMRARKAVVAALTGPAPAPLMVTPTVRDNKSATTRSARRLVEQNKFLSTDILL